MRVDVILAVKIAERIKDRIQSEYGTDRPYIAAPSKGGRDRDIVRRVRGGERRCDIAEAYGVSRRTVDNIINRSRNANTHGDGFGSSDWNL